MSHWTADFVRMDCVRRMYCNISSKIRGESTYWTVIRTDRLVVSKSESYGVESCFNPRGSGSNLLSACLLHLDLGRSILYYGRPMLLFSGSR